MNRISLAVIVLTVGSLLPFNILCAQQITVEFFSGKPAAVNKTELDEDKLPSITYGSSRSSNKRVATANGAQIAVDDGIQYDGKTFYLGLTWHLAAVDDKTDKTVWSTNVSAFWNKLSIESITLPGDEKKTFVVSLRTGKNDDTKNMVEYYDLNNGRKIKLPKADEPSGKALKLRKAFNGNIAANEKPIFEVITKPADWDADRAELFTGIDNPPVAGDLFDPEKEIALVISTGNATNCSGITFSGVFEDDKRILMRLHYRTYQTDGNPPTVRPYGIFVLPKHDDKKYVLEKNHQGYIGGPPIWKLHKEFELD